MTTFWGRGADQECRATWVRLLMLWFYSPPPPVQTSQWDTAGLVRHHCSTDTAAVAKIHIDKLAHIQIWQDGMSLLQILQASTDQLIVWLPPFLWSLFLFLASSFLLQAPISMHKHRSSVLSGSLSPSQVIFSLLNETFMTQVCGPKYNECCCHWKGCIIHRPEEVKHIGWKQAPLSNQFGLNSVTALKILRRKVPRRNPQEGTTSFAFPGTTRVSVGLSCLVYLLNTQSLTVAQPHVNTALFIFRLQLPSVVWPTAELLLFF